MISVSRSEKPAVFRKYETVWLNAILSEHTTGKKARLFQKYRHKSIQLALQIMFNGKCAYCESIMNHVSFANIDHYRPKIKFPLLIFDWNNLLLSCQRCNIQKGDEFPDKTEGVPIINPTIDVPMDHLNFHFDPVSKIASVYGISKRGQTTENVLKLNRFDLRRHRSDHVIRLTILAKLAATDIEAKEILISAQLDSGEYSAFIRALSESAV